MKAGIDFPDTEKEVYFDINLVASSCTKRWRYPLGTPNFNSTYILAMEPLKIEFTKIDVTNCPFRLEIHDVNDVDYPTAVNDTVYKLLQPELVQNPTDSMQVSILRYGSLLVQTNEIRFEGEHNLRLSIISQRYEGDTEAEFVYFTVNVVKCLSVYADLETEYYLEYVIGDPTVALTVVDSVYPDCTSSYMSLVPALNELPAAFSVANDTSSRQVIISLQASSVEEIGLGNHTVEVWETDMYSGLNTKTIFTISVQAQEINRKRNKTDEPPQPPGNQTKTIPESIEPFLMLY